MTRARLSIIGVLFFLPVLVLGWLTLSETGLNWSLRQVESYLPENLRWHTVEGNLIGPVTIKNFEYQQDGTIINIEQITLDWSPMALFAANIDIKQLQIKSLTIVLPATEANDSATKQPEKQKIVLPEISLPWRLHVENAEINGASINQNDQVFNLKKIKLSATSLFSKINIKQLSINADTFELNIKGKLQPTHDYHHTLDVSWQFNLPNNEVINGEGQLAGDMKTTRIKQNINGALQLTLEARVDDLLSQLRWTARTDISHFDTSKLNTDLPALSGASVIDAKGDLNTAELTGDLRGQYPELGVLNARFNLHRLADNTIKIDQLKLLAPENNTQLNAQGLWKPDNDKKNAGGNIQLTLDWKNLRWPIRDTPWFNSVNGSGRIAGNLNAYQITIDTDSPWPLASPSTWHADATGNLDGMKISTLRINAMDGEANVSGQLNWSPQLSWQADGVITNLNPGTLLPQWPGQLKGKVRSKAYMEKGQLIIHGEINQLNGELRNYPLSLNSKVIWRDNYLDISQLELLSGKSQVKLNGKFGETLNLNWSVNSDDLAELYPQAKGQLDAQGKLSGPQQSPLIEVSFNAKSLSYPNIAVANIEGELAVDLFHWEKLDIKLIAQALRLNDYQLQTLNIDADKQNINTQLVSDIASVKINFSGDTDKTGWRGHITQADIESMNLDNWQLKEPAALSFNKSSVVAETICLQNNQAASICTLLKHDKTTWRVLIETSQLPLKLFSQWIPPDLKLQGVANGTAELELQLPDQLLANIDINLPAGAIRYPMINGENDQREYRGGTIQLALNPQGLTASSELNMVNGDHFFAQLELPGLKLLASKNLADKNTEQTLKANAQLHAKDLRLIETLIPDVYDLQGELNIRLVADGTVEHPTLRGQANILNGTLKIPRLGVYIDQLNLNSQSSGDNQYKFLLDAHSGDGKLAISGQTKLDKAAGWPTEINIKGNDFEAARIPEARLLVSPDLQIKVKHRDINVTGKVHIPYAKLQPKDITKAENVSSDTIIIGGEEAAEEKWLIHTSVRLTLGERVHFYGFGFEGRLGGDLLLQDEPGQLTSATGQITVPEGIYRAYGQRLEIENGRILYTGGPLTNPGMDLRAVRKVNDITAGIHVKGSLTQPQLEIFSTPAMSQTDALAYIILGGPIDNASREDGSMMAKAALALGLSGGDSIARSLGDRFGLDDFRVDSSDNGDQAALVVGRYLSPKLYASYGVGLVERVDTLTLRYHISKKWQLKIESGGYQGADMLYTIER